MTEREVIEKYGLEHLDGEGGYFRFITGFGEDAGCIYYLVTKDEWSHLHMLENDELWFFLEGDPAEQVEIDEKDGTSNRAILSCDNRSTLVKKGMWQATRLVEGGSWALFSTVMAPHYRDEDYHAPTEELLERIPEARLYG